MMMMMMIKNLPGLVEKLERDKECQQQGHVTVISNVMEMSP